MSRAKRHHYVPAAYLARFGENGRVLVRRRGTPKLFVTSVKNIAVESGFYEVSGADGRPSDVLERALSRLENKALSAVAAIGETGQLPPDGSAEREILAEFLAIQFTRTPFSRERILFFRTCG